jgi:hypothetical protein
MPILETQYADEVAETAHWSDDPPNRIEEQEFDLLAFDLWHLGNRPDLTDTEEWEDDLATSMPGRASCL